MDAINWLIAANAALWIGLGAYMLFLLNRQANLEKRIQQMETLHD